MTGQVKAARYSEQVEVKTIQSKPMVRLCMTEEHARVLHTILCKVGGYQAGLRGYSEDIARSLEALRVGPIKAQDDSGCIYEGEGKIYFRGELPKGWSRE